MIKKTIKNLKLIRKKLKNKKIVTSGWMQLSNTNLTELMCSINFDCITFDLEHGVFSTGDFPDLFRTAELYNKLPLVRLPNKNINICKQALDAGAGGLIIPRYFQTSSIFNGWSHVLFTPDANLDARQALSQFILLFDGLTTNQGA